jgi:hypothetical protein
MMRDMTLSKKKPQIFPGHEARYPSNSAATVTVSTS